MATLRKRKRKGGQIVYLIDFTYNGKRFIRSTKTGDLSTAKLILKQIEAKIARGNFNVEEISPNKKVFLTHFIKEYLEYSQKHKAYKTFICDQSALKNFLRFVGQNTLLNSIDKQVIDQYLNDRTKFVKKTSANIELRHLKAAFTKAVEWNYLQENPFKGVKPFAVPRSTPIFLTVNELNILLDIIDENWLKDIVIFAVNTGVRLGELVNVEWSDLDFNNRIINIRNKAQFMTKSKTERTIPMNDDVFQMLINMNRPSTYVFTTSKGEKRGADFVSKKFKKYIIKSGLNKKYCFHTLRHTFASHLVQRGVSIYIVSRLLGHSDIKTTEIYAHLVPDTLIDVVNLLQFAKSTKQETTTSPTILKLYTASMN